jgi:hypothetical protein
MANRVFDDVTEATTIADVTSEIIKLRKIFDGYDGIAHKSIISENFLSNDVGEYPLHFSKIP